MMHGETFWCHQMLPDSVLQRSIRCVTEATITSRRRDCTICRRDTYDPKVRRFLNADDASVLTKDPEQLTEKNLYAYCDDNPVMYRDDAGMFVITATAIEITVGAIINVATSYIAAKATGQKFGIGDCVVAAIAGAVSVIIPRSFTAMVASAFFTGMGTTVLSCMAGDGLKTAISKGAIAGACMYMSINTYMAIRIPITKEMPSLATTVFGAGSNIMAATGIAVYSSKRTNGKKYQKHRCTRGTNKIK